MINIAAAGLVAAACVFTTRPRTRAAASTHAPTTQQIRRQPRCFIASRLKIEHRSVWAGKQLAIEYGNHQDKSDLELGRVDSHNHDFLERSIPRRSVLNACVLIYNVVT